MAIIPTDFLSNIFQRADTASMNTSEALSAISDANRQAILDLVSSLSPGDTLVGKILSADSNNLTILTKDGLTLSAKNGGEVLLTEGESVSFAVERVNKRNVTLRPLYQNTSRDQTTVLALRQASIPINARTLEMTAKSMQYGNPIDSDSLLSVYKDVSEFPDFSASSIVDLKMMEIPLSEANLRQYDAYMNAENSISEGFLEVSKNLGDIAKQSLESLLGDMIKETILTSDDGEESYIPAFNNKGANPEGVLALTRFLDEFLKDPKSGSITLGRDELTAITDKFEAYGLNHENLDLVKEPLDYPRTLSAFVKDIIKGSAGLYVDVGSELSYDSLNSLSYKYEGLKDLLNSDIIHKYLDKALTASWSLNLSKEALTNKTEISDLYERLYSQTRQLTELLNSSARDFTSVTQPLSQISENVEFMNALNNFVPYIQVPFNNGNDSDKGELYVFSNKKNMAGKDGEITAFIHLDMSVLGSTDVYVRLSDSNAISTKFTFEDDDALSFVSEHIDLLSARIREKGYSFNAEFVEKGNKENSIMQDILDMNTRKMLVASTSFDARV